MAYFFWGGGKDLCPSDNKIIGMPIVLFPNLFPNKSSNFVNYYIKDNYQPYSLFHILFLIKFRKNIEVEKRDRKCQIKIWSKKERNSMKIVN